MLLPWKLPSATDAASVRRDARAHNLDTADGPLPSPALDSEPLPQSPSSKLSHNDFVRLLSGWWIPLLPEHARVLCKQALPAPAVHSLHLHGK